MESIEAGKKKLDAIAMTPMPDAQERVRFVEGCRTFFVRLWMARSVLAVTPLMTKAKMSEQTNQIPPQRIC
jgi:hypothetical protein